MNIYLVATGHYDDYSIEAILSHEQQYNLKGLFAQFEDETGVREKMHRTWDIEVPAAQREWSDAMKLTEERKWPSDGKMHRFYADCASIFIAWLIQTQGFTKHTYNELTLSV